MGDNQMNASLQIMHRFLRLQSRGVSIKKTFETLELHERGKSKVTVQAMRRRLESGDSLASVFSLLISNPQMLELLETAERGNRFMDGMEQVLQLSTMRSKLAVELKRMVRYPLIILFILLLLGAIYALYIFPKLLAMVDVEAASGVSALLLSRWFFPLLFLFFVSTLIGGVVAGRKGVRLPIRLIERGRRLYVTYLFVSELSLLQETETTVRHVISRLALETGEVAMIARRIHERMSNGVGIEAATREERLIDHEVVSLLGVGSVSGELGNLMALHRDLVFEEMERYSKRLLGKVEPMIYGVLSVMVGSLFYSLYLPVKLIMAQI